MAYIGQEPGLGEAERFIFTASGSETTVTADDDGLPLNYTVNQLSLYLNGVKLVLGTDFTATNGSTITGLSALTAGDVVEIIALSTFSPADTVPATGGTFTGNVTHSGDLRSGTLKAADGTASITIANSTGNVEFAGDFTVNGTTSYINTTTVEVEDNILQLNTTQASPDTATAATSGISVYRGNGVTQASLIFDDADDTWDITNNLKVAGSVQSGDLILKSPVNNGHYTIWEEEEYLAIKNEYNGKTYKFVLEEIV